MAHYRLELGPVPLHHQVYLDLKAALDGGELKPGDRVPPERELAGRYGCSVITVRRALDELAREQRIERIRGKGTFVLAPRVALDVFTVVVRRLRRRRLICDKSFQRKRILRPRRGDDILPRLKRLRISSC